MGLAVAGERSLWLNLSSLRVKQFKTIIITEFDLSKCLFGPTMKQGSEEGEE